MSFKTNTHLEGTFTILDINGNVLSEQKNKILDWGMCRITGHQVDPLQQTSQYVMSLADNLRKIWIGHSMVPANGSQYALVSYVDGDDYTETNEPTITGTFYSLDDPGTPNEKMRIKFVKGSRFDFLNSTLSQVYEVGISSNYQPPYGRHLVGNHEWVPTTANPASANKKGGPGPYGSGWPYPHENKLETSLFSRAVMSSPIGVIKGDVLIIKYVLEVVTNAHLRLDTSSFPIDTTTITTGTVMPERKTNIRRKFFYELLPDNTVSGTLQSAGYQGGRATSASGPNNSAFYWNCVQQFLPMLEVPAWGRNYIALYDGGISPSLYAELGNGTTNNPATTALDADYQGDVVGTGIYYPPGAAVPITKALWYIGKKDRTSFKTLSSGDTITCQHRFLFNPGEWPTAGSTPTVATFAFLRQNISTAWAQYGVNTWDVQPTITDRSKVGMVTALIAPYNPYASDSALYLGIDYTMTFTRG